MGKHLMTIIIFVNVYISVEGQFRRYL
jgi:hypothetical protein